MVSMLRHTIHEGIRTHPLRRIVFIYSDSDGDKRVFFDEVRGYAKQSGGLVQVYSTLGQAGWDLVPGKDFLHSVRITKDFLQSVLLLDDYD
jgi:hypothetical protein